MVNNRESEGERVKRKGRALKMRESAQPGMLNPYSLPFETWLNETLSTLQEDGGKVV